MKRIYSISLASLLLMFVFSLVGQAKTQSDSDKRTLTVYIQAPKSGGTINFISPVLKTVSVNASTKVTMEDYLYVGGI